MTKMTHSEKANKQAVQRIFHLISSLEAGGAQRALYTLLEADKDNPAVQHTVLYLHDGPYHAKLHELGVAVESISGVFGVYDPTIVLRLTGKLYRLRPHLIHTSLWFAGVLGRISGRLLRVPVLCDLHSNANHHGRVRNTVDRWTAGGAQYCAVSQQVKQAFIAQTAIPEKTISVIYNGVDGEAIRTESASYHSTRTDLGIPSDSFVMGAVGRLVPIKQLDHLLWCHATLCEQEKHRSIFTCIVGDGPERKRLQKTAEDLGIADNVLFLGHRNDVYGLYPLFNCLVMPSKSEGLSYALLEALACGVPVVVRHEGEQHEVITDGEHGFVVPARCGSDGLVMGVLKLLRDPEKYSQVKDKNIALVRNDFARSTMVTRYHALYAQLGVQSGTW
jgi:glycosyltransferase involved in cell wall biosynthesis